ncbi:MAG: MucB/RseB C-terminal domain-containing protein [Gammaproteobacteria bacterium]
MSASLDTTLVSERVFRQLVACLLGLVLAPSLALADGNNPDARAWLDKMTLAMQRLNYDGTFVYLHDQHFEAMRIVHQAEPQGERERVVSLTGAAREIIQDGDHFTCYMPDQKSVMIGRSQPHKPYPLDFPEDTSRLTRNYVLAVSHADRMAGRDARIVTITPRDPYRYGYRLWLETDTGMPLKSDLLDEHGATVEQVMFTTIEFLKQIPAGLLQPTMNGSGYTRHNDVGPSGENLVGERSAWRVTRLPDGFMLTHYSRHPLPNSSFPTEHMVFSDALASLSVYIEQADDDKKMLNGTSRMGAVNAFGTVVNGHHVTVVGDVPSATVQMVGESIRYQPDPTQ